MKSFSDLWRMINLYQQLNEEIQMQIILHSMKSQTQAELIHVATSIEISLGQKHKADDKQKECSRNTQLFKQNRSFNLNDKWEINTALTSSRSITNSVKNFKSFNKKRFEGIICHNCNKTDHIIRNCRGFKNTNNKQKVNSTSVNSKD